MLVATGTALTDGRNEQITFTAPAAGTYYIKVSSENGTDGDYVLDRSLAANPTIGSFSPGSNPVSSGGNETLTVSNITDSNPSGSITQVAIYLDSNSDGILEPGSDTLLGYATQTSPGVWTYTFTVSLSPGNHTLFAQAEDSYGLFSDPVAIPQFTVTYVSV
jgi:hypothetical protein